jgi:predicted membrane chloride channel (bestrophin family)
VSRCFSVATNSIDLTHSFCHTVVVLFFQWDEARKNWGMNINHTRDLVRLGNAMYDKKGVSPQRRKEDLKVLALCTWAFVRCMKRHLSPEDEDEAAFRQELYEKLPEQQAAAIIAAAHRPNRALQDLSTAIENLPMHFMRKHEIHKAVTIFEDNLGSSERLLTSPVPLFYSRHTARFLSFFLLLLPFGLYEAFSGSWNHIAMIPTTAAISVFLFGIEELATQLEEPFTILPMQVFCDKIYNWCNEIVSFEAGDNGMTINEPRREHTVAFLGADLAGPSAVEQTTVTAPMAEANGGANGEHAAAANGVNGGKRAALARFLKG